MGWPICCMARLGTPAMPPDISGYAGIVMAFAIDVGMCMDACMAEGEPYDRDRLCGVEYDECSDM